MKFNYLWHSANILLINAGSIQAYAFYFIYCPVYSICRISNITAIAYSNIFAITINNTLPQFTITWSPFHYPIYVICRICNIAIITNHYVFAIAIRPPAQVINPTILDVQLIPSVEYAIYPPSPITIYLPLP